MVAPRMGGKRKARGAPNGGSIGVTSNAAIAIQTKRGPCQQEIEADFFVQRRYWRESLRGQDGHVDFLRPHEVSGLAHLDRNGGGNTSLNDVQFGPTGNRREADRGQHLARQVRIVEDIRVTNAFIGHQFAVFTAK